MRRMVNRKSLFRNAESYLEAAFTLGAATNQRLETMPSEQADEALKILEPTVLCEALSCELYFKLYIDLTGGRFDRVHGLYDLYKALSMPNREKLGHAYAMVIVQHPRLSPRWRTGVDQRRWLEYVLERSNQAFVQVRYWHEELPKDANSTWPIALALRQCILDIDPDLINTHS